MRGHKPYGRAALSQLQICFASGPAQNVSFLKKNFFSNCIVSMGFLPWEILGSFPWEKPDVGHAAQTMVLARCFSVSIIHRTWPWTTGALTCTQALMHAIAHGSVETL